jgi:phosphoribosylformimino-5-aminoimidazole carboxamide ribonucleotide (ProFAR) isomerase
VGFDILPALDLSGGRLCTLSGGEPVPVEAFGGDPLAAGSAFVSQGAAWLHVVDLDLALRGAAGNLAVVTALAELGVSIQASGGIRTPGHSREMFGAGASRVVLGSAALADRPAFLRLLEEDPQRSVVGLEVAAGRITSRGPVRVNLPLTETLAWLDHSSVGAFLLTLVETVGGLGGTDDLDTVSAVIQLGMPVMVAGGISTIEQIERLRALGATGVVVGRAALEGVLDLRSAFDRTGRPGDLP